jgi:hypothetical protein
VQLTADKSQAKFATMLSKKFVFPFFSENIKIKLYGSLILLIDVGECKFLSLKLGEKYTLRLFENGVLSRIRYPKGKAVTGKQRNCILKSCMIFTPHPIFLVHAVAQLVEVLHYKPADHGVDSRLLHWNFSLT